MNASHSFRSLDFSRSFLLALVLASPAMGSEPRHQTGFFTRLGNAVSRLTNRVERMGDSLDEDRSARTVSRRRTTYEEDKIAAPATVVVPPMGASGLRDPYQPIPQPRYGTQQVYSSYTVQPSPRRVIPVQPYESPVPAAGSVASSTQVYGRSTVTSSTPVTSQAYGTTITLSPRFGAPATPPTSNAAVSPAPTRTQTLVSSYRPGASLSKISTLDAPWQEPSRTNVRPQPSTENMGDISPVEPAAFKPMASRENQPPSSPPSTPAPSTAADTSKTPLFAVPLGNHQVRCPLPPYTVLDVEGMMTGSLAKDPASGQVFKVP